MKTSKRISLLVHGPLTAYSKLVLSDASRALRKDWITEIIISTYERDVGMASSYFKNLFSAQAQKITIKGSKDVANPGFSNINRQINLVNAGLADIHPDNLIIKLRSDQRVNFRCVLSAITRFDKEIEAEKIMTTNCFTRIDRLYHPSDMFLIGKHKTLRDYYPRDFFTETALDDTLAIRADLESGFNKALIAQWPESRLFRNMLCQRGWTFKEDHADSLLALRNMCIVLDARMIGLKWQKFCRGLLPLVPHHINMAPFEGGPLEDIRCAKASDFGGCSKMTSELTALLSTILWSSALRFLRK